MATYRDGKNVSSAQWQAWKRAQPGLTSEQREVAFGLLMGDGGAAMNGSDAYIKVEQGVNQKALVEALFSVLWDLCWMTARFARQGS